MHLVALLHPARRFFKFQPRKKMKPLVTIAVIFFSLALQAQSVTLNFRQAPLETVFKEIQRQTGYGFIYTREQLRTSLPVTIDLQQAPLATALALCMKNQPLTCQIEDRYVIVRDKPAVIPKTISEEFEVTGRVVDNQGQPLEGATIYIRQQNRTMATGANGGFHITKLTPGTELVFSNVGHQSRDLVVTGSGFLLVELTATVNNLDETLVVGYGTTTKRLNTGSVGRVSGSTIEKQPVFNPLLALPGRVPGVLVTQQNGMPGTAVKILVRGRTSINDNINNDPLFIIDGVPFAPNNTSVNAVGSALGNTGLSPFNAINPADIESIEILKDADATAIYGSRGANGVVLITTRRGRPGKTTATLNLRSGFSRLTHSMDFMNTPQYLEMRREAFANDGLVPNTNPSSTGFAPDLLLWDTTRYTDFRKLLTDGTAHQTDLQLSVSGGNEQTRFLMGAGHARQTTIFPGDLYDRKGSFHIHLDHQPAGQRWQLTFKGSYVQSKTNINITDPSSFLRLPPNLPPLYDSAGNLNWQHAGVNFDNPLAHSLREYEATTDNLLANLQVSYKPGSGLSFRSSAGFNIVNTSDIGTTPNASLNPVSGELASANFGATAYRTLILEPQMDYKRKFGRLKLELVAGATIQFNQQEASSISGSGYNNDALLRSIRSAATVVVRRSDKTENKYAAVFGRANLNWQDKYIVNFTGRRDGSSRFGPGKQFANFGAAGIAWLFSKEAFIRKTAPFLSHGKLRISYGSTGNDKIGDYGFLSTYSTTGISYGGVPAITPTGLSNPDFAWELNRKLEAGLEAAFLNDRLQFTLACYRNECSNQLINYTLPSQTGANSVIANFPATVLNKGVELEITGVAVQRKKLEWVASFNITVPKTILETFPGFSSSSYFSILELGHPLNIVSGYRFAGVNSQTGLFEYYDEEGKATSAPGTAARVKSLVYQDPSFYGGIGNRLRYNQVELEIFMDFKKQQGLNYLGNMYGSNIYPGTFFNQPVEVLSRWRQPGDISMIQKYTTRSGTPAYNAANIMRLSGSDYMYSDASFLRLRNVSLSYRLSKRLLDKWRISGIALNLQAQNLYTFTMFRGTDPETQNIYRLPPLRTIVAGVQVTF